MDGADSDWRLNNFDLIRLFAALQVALVHAITDFKPPGLGVAIFDAGIRMFPGVPIFFLISGLLISRSYERSASWWDYCRNRCLRIFPALWVCLVASIGLIVMMIHAPTAVDTVSRGEWLLWWAAQMSLFQQYAPDFLRGLRLNGSLWTIPVELEFYLLLPLIYAVFGLRNRSGDAALVGILAASAVIHWLFVHMEPGSLMPRFSILLDTIVPYLWMFLTGVLIQRHWAVLRQWLVGKAHWWLPGYILGCAVSRQYFHVGVGSADFNAVFLLPLAGTVMSCAMTARSLAQRLLTHNDISYGLYIYHMPVIAALLQLRAPGSVTSVLVAVGIAATLGALSWFGVERHFLASKRHAMHAATLSAGSSPDPGGLHGSIT
jgi:peptidoglycan/LPS O-acetylase OafA/YrhL